MAAISGVEPVRGWVPEWYTWAQFGAASRAPLGGSGSERQGPTIHRKLTAEERMPVDVLLLKNNGELS